LPVGYDHCSLTAPSSNCHVINDIRILCWSANHYLLVAACDYKRKQSEYRMQNHSIPSGVDAAPYLPGELRNLPERLSYCSPSAGMVESPILQTLQTDFSLKQCPCFSLQICKPLVTHTFWGSNSAQWAAARPTLLFCHLGGLAWCRTVQHHAFLLEQPVGYLRCPSLGEVLRSAVWK
jgi:hypothetical protein